MAKTKIAVLFGGVSNEHEISCLSAAFVVDSLPDDLYEVYKIGITKMGRWLLFPDGTDQMRDGSWATCCDNVPAVLSPDRTTRGMLVGDASSARIVKLDAVFPVLHGKGGEDGTVQGLLELAGIPCVGSGVLASALCMDKAWANLAFEHFGLPHTPWVAAGPAELDDFDTLLFRLKGRMDFPIFVKPCIGGSSVGVSKAKDPEALQGAIKLARAHNDTILFEEAVVGREVEVAVLGNDDPIATLPGEIESCNEIYDYEAKYHSGDASRLYLEARLPRETLEEIRSMAVRAYTALGCAGLARVDFFVQENGRVLINEINTIPGFTPISMYPKLMEHVGIKAPQLCHQLVQYALERAGV